MKVITACLMVSAVLIAAGCDRQPAGSDTAPAAVSQPSAAAPASNAAVVDVIAHGMQFSAPSDVPSGWVTFRFHNQSPYTHFALVERWPEAHSLADGEKEIAPIFQTGMDLLIKGDKDAAMKKFGELPEWMKDIVYIGGPGLTAPGYATSATMKLEPGRYVIECYVKTDGVFHSSSPEPGVQGMTHEFTVTASDSGAGAPDADIHLRISSDQGIQAEGNVSPGEHTVSVHYVDQKAYGNFVGHDVHLVKLADDTDQAGLMQWMDWMNPSGLSTPAPAEFRGGLNEMPAASDGYFTVTLDPGRYAWISEVPDPDKHGLFVPFTVAPATAM